MPLLTRLIVGLTLAAAAGSAHAAVTKECQANMAKLTAGTASAFATIEAEAATFVQTNTADCAAEFAKQGNCTRDVDWRYKEGDVNTLKDAVAKADKHAHVCALDMMGRNSMGIASVRYTWTHATWGFVAGNCTAEDVTQLTYSLAATYAKAYAPYGCTELVLAVSDPDKCKWPQQ